jgi:type IV secretory pathway TrbD component
MKDFDHLMSVWQEQPKKDQLSVDDVLKQVNKGMSGLSNKLFWGIIIMVSSFVGLLAVMLFFVFTSWITYIGITILLITLLLYSMVMLRDYRLISKQDITDPIQYLQSLKDYQKNRAELYGWLFYLYVILLSSGLVLYFYEVLQNATTTFKVIIYSASGLWFLFCTFYLKDRFVKNEQKKINDMIERLARLQNQFD